ncbi:[FeFe] hydrogenase H-cluster maturation GTPase HydF [Oceanirhabdus seepicola]|uniref:[FeFe] hydrogenase H-cluster maturation GTPase HydF n=1 Tax=Oceanirhabdus seepicola TaxID=2828781 RepID=A0A9J6PB78_9CLOT|nr:[FeFe] hydrogenase H-cluster maturation GTPase HydF [Oceanirhabdus seepicola]MCM1992368.1 [FeFe] hydrogenase H-cluster maturation GTPase HydF [Oceanirhabdus seepicola]
MIKTPKANRLHIGIFGKRNSGKSSLINAITGQEMALVSDLAGTTTDPVYKAMELLPIGPVTMIDTAGFDDEGVVGELRVKKSREVLDKTDIALVVFSPEDDEFSYEEEWLCQFKKRKIPVIGVLNKLDLLEKDLKEYEEKFNIPFVSVSAKEDRNIDELKKVIIRNSPSDYEMQYIARDLVGSKALVLLVAPQDIQAPKGRLILPQVQTIRDLLDGDAMVLTVKLTELEDSLKVLSGKPDLVITDSQVFEKVNEILDEDVPLTSFSILMARFKGDLEQLVEGAQQIDNLKDGDKVLIAEACTHHALKGDIGREKLPNWLKERTGAELDVQINAGCDFVEDLSQFKLIIHCGACMFNRKQMITRIEKARECGIPITNYGVAIAHMKGMLQRVMKAMKSK